LILLSALLIAVYASRIATSAVPQTLAPAVPDDDAQPSPPLVHEVAGGTNG
jgi:hypothetical protein